MNESRRIIGLIYARANSIDISGPLQVFDTASRLLLEAGRTHEPAYIVETVGKSFTPMQLTGGLRVSPHYSLDDHPSADTLIIPGGQASRETAEDPVIYQWLARHANTTRRIASTCTGAFILAKAQLLEQRKVATHWQYAEELASQYPNIQVDADAIFIRDGQISTSAGVTAGIDLALALVEEDWGIELALNVARNIVVFLKRSGDQSQFSPLLQIQNQGHSKVYRAQQWILEHLHEDLNLEHIAEQHAMSSRHFARLFKQETNKTVGEFITRARLDAARSLLESSNLPIASISAKVGFGHSETMRRLFTQYFNTSPSQYRSHFSSQ